MNYDLGPVVKPRDDIENKTARLGGVVVLLFLSCLVMVAQTGDFACI